MNNKKMKVFATIALFTSGIIWGSAFLIMKNALDEMPAFYLLAIRLTAAAIILGIIFCKKWRLINKKYILQGSILGLFLAGGYIFQTYGLMYTTPGKNAFLTAGYCIVVPFMYWIIEKKKPSALTVLAGAICVIGIGFVSVDSNLSIAKGDILTILCSFFYAAHIIGVSKFSKDKDIILLTIIQFISGGLLCWILGGAFEQFPTEVNNQTIMSMVYLCVFSTAVALLFQNIGQKYIAPSSASIILSLESVFGVMFSIVFGYENLNLKITVGFVLIFISVIISQLNLKKKN